MLEESGGSKIERFQETVVAYQSFLATIAILKRDVELCAEMANSTQDQFWCRSLVRSIFAEVEGTIHRMKLIAYACREQEGVRFSTGEKHVMLERPMH
jgi:hypothetical protein